MSDSIESSGSESLDGSQIEENSVEGESDEGEELPQPTPAEIKKIKKLKLKFNGKEIEEELPFEVEEQHAEWLAKQRQKAMLADHKAREYNQLENEVGAFINQLRNPKTAKKALMDPRIGMDIKELAAEILQEEIERSQKSPEQLRAEEAEAKLQEMLEEREREKRDNEARELERLTEREYERYDNLMSSAIESSDLPKSPYVVKKMTELMILAVENNIDIDPKDVIPMIREEIQRDVSQMFGVMPAEMIEQILGKDTLGKLKNHRKASAGKPPVPVKAAVKDVAKTTEEKKETQKKQTVRDFFGV